MPVGARGRFESREPGVPGGGEHPDCRQEAEFQSSARTAVFLMAKPPTILQHQFLESIHTAP